MNDLKNDCPFQKHKDDVHCTGGGQCETQADCPECMHCSDVDIQDVLRYDLISRHLSDKCGAHCSPYTEAHFVDKWHK